PDLVVALQDVLSREVSGARVSVRELDVGPTVGIPVSLRLSGDNLPTLRAYGEKLMAIFRANPYADRVQDDWGAQSFAVDVAIDPDRASMAGLGKTDVGITRAIGLHGAPCL